MFGFLSNLSSAFGPSAGESIERSLPPSIRPARKGSRVKLRLPAPVCAACHVNLSAKVCKNRMCERFGMEQTR